MIAAHAGRGLDSEHVLGGKGTLRSQKLGNVSLGAAADRRERSLAASTADSFLKRFKGRVLIAHSSLLLVF